MLILENYKREVTGILQVAQSRFFVQRIESALADSDHERAAAAVLATARQSTEYNLSPKAWRELITIGLIQAAKAGSRSLLAEIIEQYTWLAWSGEGNDSQPWELGEHLEDVDRKAGAYLGDLLARAYPDCALGPYAAAHFREQDQLAKNAAIEPTWAANNAARFERAALLAERAGRAVMANHCRLRQGVTLMLGKVESQTARGLLKKLDKDALSPRELLWYAIGMMLSDFWLDRVRAADTIDAIATDVIEARPGPTLRAIDKPTIEHLVDYLLARQGLELQAAEEDRVRALIELVYKDSWRARQKNASLELLLDLQQRVRSPLTSDECADLIEQLEDRAPTMGEAWTLSARMMRALHLQLSPAQDSPPLPRQPPSDRHTYSLRALELLAAIEADDPGAIEQALLQTRKSLGEQPVGKDPDAATPLAVSLPGLLAWIKSNAPKKRRPNYPPPTEEEEAFAERHDFIRELTQVCVRAWAPQARPPSYGWWELAAHMIDAKLPAGADAVGIRAISSHTSPDPSLRDFVLGGLLSWSIEVADRPAMMRWLETAEAL